jgi:hypothetical protein
MNKEKTHVRRFLRTWTSLSPTECVRTIEEFRTYQLFTHQSRILFSFELYLKTPNDLKEIITLLRVYL